jgi:hypothetical protein
MKMKVWKEVQVPEVLLASCCGRFTPRVKSFQNELAIPQRRSAAGRKERNKVTMLLTGIELQS